MCRKLADDKRQLTSEKTVELKPARLLRVFIQITACGDISDPNVIPAGLQLCFPSCLKSLSVKRKSQKRGERISVRWWRGEDRFDVANKKSGINLSEGTSNSLDY